MGRGDGVYFASSKLKAQSSKVISAPEGFVFDQMYLSPDKRKIVVWEISDGFYLKEGKSRITLYKLESLGNLGDLERRVLIEQEGSSGRVYYPVFWSKDSQSIYVDTLDTKGGGLYKGLYEVESTRIERIGTNKTDIKKVLGESEYSTVPVLSPNGKKLAYTSNNSGGIVVLNLGDGTDKTDRTDKTYIPIEGARYYNLVWGPESKRLAVKAVNGGKDEFVIFEVFGGAVLEKIESFAGVFAWQEENLIALSARVEGFGGLGGEFIQPGSLPAKGVYLYNLTDKTYRKVYSDNIISIIR
jgi:WD40 repeat protein